MICSRIGVKYAMCNIWIQNLQRVVEKLAVKANSATEQLQHAQSQARSFDDPSSAVEALKQKVRLFLRGAEIHMAV